MLLTYRYRIKDSTSKKKLKKLASAVNFVWNYINELSWQNAKKHERWLSAYDIHPYLNGAGEELGLCQNSLQEIARYYVSSRRIFKKIKLRWRSAKRSLGWVPFKGTDVRVSNDTVIYKQQTYRFYRSRPLPKGSRVRIGSIAQDARDRWYVSFVVEVPEKAQHDRPGSEVGIDLGVKEQIALSDGQLFSRENLTKRHELKLTKLQRAGKKRQARNLHAKIRNVREDWTHKATAAIARQFETIVVGDLKAKELIAKNPKISKGILDASPTRITYQLEYKAKRLGGQVSKVPEHWTTMTCSTCFERTGPSGLNGLSVRGWTCSQCGTEHHRDVNSAKNILRLGRQALLKEPTFRLETYEKRKIEQEFFSIT